MPTGVYPRTEKHMVLLRRLWEKNKGRALSLEARTRISEHHKGMGNPFYGRRHTPESKAKMGNPPKVIKIEPTKDWGYFIGIVLGDGWINKHNYQITVGSTQPEIVDAFRDVCELLGVHYNYSAKVCKIRPKNPTGMNYRCIVSSKILHKFIAQYKKPDFHWEIPPMVLDNDDMLVGFLQGIYDAEGGVYLYKQGMGAIELSSKHASNLMPIQECLSNVFMVVSKINDSEKRTAAKLVINEYTNRVRFRELIGFRLERKQLKLENMPKRKRRLYSIRTYLYALMLLQNGFPTKEITKRAKIHRNTLYEWRDGAIPPNLRT